MAAHIALAPHGHPTLPVAVCWAAVQAVDACRWCWLLPDPPLAWASPHERKASSCGTNLDWRHGFSCAKFSQSARARPLQYEASTTRATLARWPTTRCGAWTSWCNAPAGLGARRPSDPAGRWVETNPVSTLFSYAQRSITLAVIDSLARHCAPHALGVHASVKLSDDGSGD